MTVRYQFPTNPAVTRSERGGRQELAKDALRRLRNGRQADFEMTPTIHMQ
jgi:hypothetical protein